MNLAVETQERIRSVSFDLSQNALGVVAESVTPDGQVTRRDLRVYTSADTTDENVKALTGPNAAALDGVCIQIRNLLDNL